MIEAITKLKGMHRPIEEKTILLPLDYNHLSQGK